MTTTPFSQYFTQSLSSLKSSQPSITLSTYDITNENYSVSLTYLDSLFPSENLRSHYLYIRNLLGMIPPNHIEYSYHLLSIYLLIHNEFTSFSSSEYLKGVLNMKLYEITSLIQKDFSNFIN